MDIRPRSTTPEIGDQVVFLLDDDNLASIPSAAFWNDQEVELAKAYDVRDGDFAKLWHYLQKCTTLLEEYQSVLAFARELGCRIHRIGVDVAAGVCWTTAMLSRISEVDKLYAVEISKHRLLEVAPFVLQGFQAEVGKITRVLGSFYGLKLPSASVDFCMLSQAFHHAAEPYNLLGELRRVLRPGAPVLLIGEKPISPSQLLMKRMKNLLKLVLPLPRYHTQPLYSLWPSFADLYPPDEETGDHYYRVDDYHRIFTEYGFILHARQRKRYAVYIAIKR